MKQLFIVLIFAPLLGNSQIKHTKLISKMDGTFLSVDGINTPYWGFGEFNPTLPNQRISLPSPLLIYDLNDSVYLKLHNLSPEMHTIHLHGLDVTQINDGVPSTSFGVLFNDSTTYKFKAKHPGTYLYHCHVHTNLHAAMGMSGMVVIRNFPDTNLLYANGPSFNKEYYYLSSDMYLYWNFNVTSPGPFHMYEADYFMVNGKAGTQLFDDTTQIIKMSAGDTALLHIANVGYNSVEYIFPPEANAVTHMSDGRILPSPIDKDTLVLYPGERYSVLLSPTQFIQGHITVNSANLYNTGTIVGTNYIGINIDSLGQGMQDNKLAYLNLYPNPTSNSLQIQSNETLDIHVYNVQGKLFETFNLQRGINSIDVSKLSKGIYIVGANGFLPTKFIIE